MPARTQKSPQESAVETTQLVLPSHANALGTAFGGIVMQWIDIAAACAAFKHCRKMAVTASMDALHFLAPIRLGHMVTLKAMVNYAGRTSVEVGVKVIGEDPITGQASHAASAYLTFVAIDSQGNPVEIAKILPQTQEEKRRFQEADARRKIRLSHKGTSKNYVRSEKTQSDETRRISKKPADVSN